MSSETRSFSFVQVSDVHLDSRLLATGFPLKIPQRRAREEELLQALFDSFKLAVERKVDAVLIPGDLWHNESVRTATIEKVVRACAELGDIQVFICPGNRDFYSLESPYNSDALEIRGVQPWSANVHIFKSEQFTTIVHPLRPDVSFTGRAFTSEDVNLARLLSTPAPKSDTEINILLFHGALDGYMGNDMDRPNKQTAPFSLAELKSQNFTYAAIGHYHDFTEIRMDTGLLLGAYSGCPASRSFFETGPRHVLYGVIEAGRPGRWNIALEPIELDNRRLVMVAADITGLSIEDMLEELVVNIDDQGGRSETDIVFLHLEGRYSPANDPAVVLNELRERFPELVVYDNTRPDYLAETYDERTVEGRFIEGLLELKRRIERARAGTDGDADYPLSGKIVEDALYYGLDALKQRRITVRNVD